MRVREQDRTEQRVARKILSRMERTAAEPGRKGDLDATYIRCGGFLLEIKNRFSFAAAKGPTHKYVHVHDLPVCIYSRIFSRPIYFI